MNNININTIRVSDYEGDYNNHNNNNKLRNDNNSSNNVSNNNIDNNDANQGYNTNDNNSNNNNNNSNNNVNNDSSNDSTFPSYNMYNNFNSFYNELNNSTYATDSRNVRTDPHLHKQITENEKNSSSQAQYNINSINTSANHFNNENIKNKNDNRVRKFLHCYPHRTFTLTFLPLPPP